jgi:hypothetical protein
MPKTNLEDPKDLEEPRAKGALAAPEQQPKPVFDVPSIAILSNPRIFEVFEVFVVPKAFG